jgi:hypothetical protein
MVLKTKFKEFSTRKKTNEWEKRKADKSVIRNQNGEDFLGDAGQEGGIILKRSLKETRLDNLDCI